MTGEEFGGKRMKAEIRKTEDLVKKYFWNVCNLKLNDSTHNENRSQHTQTHKTPNILLIWQ